MKIPANSVQSCTTGSGQPFMPLVLLLMIFSLQYTVVDAKGPFLLPDDPPYFTLGYAGNNLWNPGMELGAGLVIHTLSGQAARSRPLARKMFFFTSIGMYLDPGSHAAIYNQYGGVYRRTGPKGWIHSLEVLPAGIYRSFLPETWAIEEGALPEKVILPGRTYYAPGMGYHLGKDFAGNTGQGWFTGCSMTLLIPYNTYVMPIFTIDLGWRFSGRKEER